MDINVISLNSAGECSYEFSLYTWSKVSMSSSPGSNKVHLENVAKFKRGTAVVFGHEVVEDTFSFISHSIEDDAVYYILEVDLATSTVTLNEPLRNGVVAGFPCVKIDKDSAQIKKSDDIYELVQYVQKCLLTNKGSDSFDPNYGSNMYQMLWQIQPTDISAARARLTIEVTNVQEYVKTIQSTNTSLRSTAKLKALVVRNVSFDYNIQRWRFDLGITPVQGTSIVVGV